ncbi:MAG: FkbM family methyltransferase [Saprospiraceae bacterium]
MSIPRLYIPDIKRFITLRPHSSDLSVFEQVMLDREYDMTGVFTFQQPVRYILDAGANAGFTSLMMAHQYPEASIVALEPESGNFALLCQNTAGLTNIHPIQAGLWSHTAHLLIIDNGVGHYGFMTEEVPLETPNAMPAMGVKELMAQYNWPYIDLLKMDIEGSEREVFSGDYHTWLPKVRCLLVEPHDRKRKGSSQALLKAINQYHFSLHISGELLCFFNEDFLPLMRSLSPFFDSIRIEPQGNLYASVPGGTATLYGTTYALLTQYYLGQLATLPDDAKSFILSCQNSHTGYFSGKNSMHYPPMAYTIWSTYKCTPPVLFCRCYSSLV